MRFHSRCCAAQRGRRPRSASGAGLRSSMIRPNAIGAKGAIDDKGRRARLWVAGVDGCPGGWIVVLAGMSASADRPVQMSSRLCTTFEQVLALPERPLSIAVDMPIGLLERAAPGGRAVRPRGPRYARAAAREQRVLTSHAQGPGGSPLRGSGRPERRGHEQRGVQYPAQDPRGRCADGRGAAGHSGRSPSRARLSAASPVIPCSTTSAPPRAAASA